MSGARLDRSQEGIELRQAVWAGFIKSRFWKIAGWIEPHKPDVVGMIICLGTLVFLGSVFLQNRLPNNTTLIVFYATIGPFSLGYVVRQNWVLLLRIWEHRLGKLFYGVMASLIGTLSKVGADQEIRLLIQSNPSLFPSAQQALTVLNFVGMTLIAIGAILWAITMAQLCWVTLTGWGKTLLSMLDIFLVTEMLGLSTQPRTSRFSLTRFFAYMWAGVFIFTVPFPFLAGDFTGVGGKSFNPTEVLLLWSSFIPNDLSLAGSDRVCINLPPNALVSPFNTREPIPNEVLLAQPIAIGPDRSGRSYSYRVVACSKLPAPGAL